MYHPMNILITLLLREVFQQVLALPSVSVYKLYHAPAFDDLEERARVAIKIEYRPSIA